MSTTTYRLSVTLDRENIDDDGMHVNTETMLRLDAESSDVGEVAAVLSAATDVIAGRIDRRDGERFTVEIPEGASAAEVADAIARRTR